MAEHSSPVAAPWPPVGRIQFKRNITPIFFFYWFEEIKQCKYVPIVRSSSMTIRETAVAILQGFNSMADSDIDRFELNSEFAFV